MIRPVCNTSWSPTEAAALLVWSVMALELVGAAMEAWRAPESSSGVTSGGFREESFFFLPAIEATGVFSEEEAVLPGDLAGGAGGITVELAGLEVAGSGEIETGVEEAELGRLNFQYQLLLNQLELKRLLGETL